MKSEPSSPKNLPSSRPLIPFEKKVLEFSRQQKLWNRGDCLVVAVSGGPDSVALLSILLSLAKKDSLRLVIAHVNYQLRGNASTHDAVFVKTIAKKNDLPCYILKAKKGRTDEASLREIRYDFFARIHKKERAQAVALGHQKNDQAETFLLRLMRGSGSTGLKAMQAKRDVYIRPLLPFSRQEILSYLEKTNTPYRTDESNTKPLYLRNRIRTELIPLLEKNYQPNIVNTLAQTASLLAQKVSPTQIPPIHTLYLKGSLCFSATELLAVDRDTRLVFLREIIQEILGKPISLRQTAEVEKVLQSTKNKAAKTSFRGLKITKKGATVTLQKINSTNQDPT